MRHLKPVLALIAVLSLVAGCSDSTSPSAPTSLSAVGSTSDTGGTANPVGTTTAAGEAGDLSGACPVLTFNLGAVKVTTNAATTFRMACAEIRNGVRVAVMGVRQADGTFVAKVVAPPPPQPPDTGYPGRDGIRLVGEVGRLSGTCPALSFAVGGLPVKTDRVTAFRLPCGEIRKGIHITVVGARQTDRGVLAGVVAPAPVRRPPR
jgi:hypothetical protein